MAKLVILFSNSVAFAAGSANICPFIQLPICLLLTKKLKKKNKEERRKEKGRVKCSLQQKSYKRQDLFLQIYENIEIGAK